MALIVVVPDHTAGVMTTVVQWLVVSAAVAFAMLGWQVPVIAISVFGLPLLFAVYLRNYRTASYESLTPEALSALTERQLTVLFQGVTADAQRTPVKATA